MLPAWTRRLWASSGACGIEQTIHASKNQRRATTWHSAQQSQSVIAKSLSRVWHPRFLVHRTRRNECGLVDKRRGYILIIASSCVRHVPIYCNLIQYCILHYITLHYATLFYIILHYSTWALFCQPWPFHSPKAKDECPKKTRNNIQDKQKPDKT